LETRFQLCGRLAFRFEGRRIDAELPGRLGRLLLVYLTVRRRRPCPREELAAALWPDAAGHDAESSLAPLVSKVRRLLGRDALEGRSSLRLRLPDTAWVDLEAAVEGIHRAESAFGRGDWCGVYGPGRVAQHIAVRGFLPGEGSRWVDEVRGRLDEIYVRALELVGAACLEIGGVELDTAQRSARSLLEAAPYRESGYRLLMDVHAKRGNRAEAVLVYDALRHRLREELGVVPSAETQARHRALLA
jgi:DNA-binding SARP family transcriptional activator